MPGLDSTGPEGQGSRTGRQMGNCRPDAEKDLGIGRGQGRGKGKGGRAFGRGKGEGRGLNFKIKK